MSVAGRLTQWLMPSRALRANERLQQCRDAGTLPRIAIVKQDCNEDLYCCAPGASVADTIASTLLRSGPVGFFTKFDTRFFIVRTEPDPECNIWKEKSDPLQWAPQEWFEGFRQHVPGRDHGQAQFAVGVDEIAWQEFDLVVSVDVSVPARITERFPQVVWAYYVREIKAPSWRESLFRPIKGQDLVLNHYFTPRRTTRAAHVVDFPYHFQYCGIFHEVFGRTGVGPAKPVRRGVFVEYHTARNASDDELRQLEEFGPVFAMRAEHDRFDPVNGERIPERSMAPDGLDALLSCKYHVKWDGRAIFGTAKVEAIAAGCLAIYTRDRDGTPFLQSKATTVDGFTSLIAALRRLEASESLYKREIERQQKLVDYLCYLRPANDLLDACDAVRRRKANLPRNIP